MKQTKLKQFVLAAAVTATVAGFTQSASAITLDYRHEYTDQSKENKDRLMISDRFANGLGYSVETKVKSGGGDSDKADTPYADMASNGAEFGISYQFSPFENWTFQPGLNAEFSRDKATYKPLFRVQYNFDNGIYVAARYRYEYTRDPNNDKPDEHLNRYEGWIGYRTGPWRGEFNFIWRDSDQVRYDNKKTDYEYDFKLSYDINKEWTPYIQVGNIKYKSTRDDRQTRFRIGIQYKY